MPLVRPIADGLLAQRGHMIGWVPVCLALGIGLYFSLRFEPSFQVIAGVAVGVACVLALSRWVPLAGRPVMVGLALIGLGVVLASARTERMAGPVLDFRYYGPIEGRVVGMDRSFSDAMRLTLDQVRLDRMSPDEVPLRVRVAIHGALPAVPVRPGQRVMTTGHLSPPSGPAEPGGFDFQRHAWFLQLGAVGYTRNPLLRAAPAEGAWETRVFAIRMRISQAVQAALPGETGAVAAAITTGDRSAIGQGSLADLRATNLAHLLAISGLHMGLLTAFVFGALRSVMMSLPWFGLRVPAKKVAAVGALIVAAGYLALSGGNVATERAFTMVAVMLVAILLDRPALTLRAVAIAATIILVLQPDALLGPGFQMSFAATTALVAVFQWLRGVQKGLVPRWAQGFASLFVASFVAGAATAPIAAVHFNQFAHYGLIANLLSVPAMASVVMPAAVLAACLAPFGLAWVGLAVMGAGLNWILWVAGQVAALPGALGHVPTPGGWVLPLIALGGLAAILWQGRARVAGVPVIAAGFVLWGMAERPALLIADSGGLIGVMGAEGRALSRAKGDGFVASVWLENDGGPVPQADAAERPGIARDQRTFRIEIGGVKIVQVSGKTALAALDGCGGADLVISNQAETAVLPCLTLNARDLRKTGSLSLTVGPDGMLDLSAARAEIGDRPWNTAPDAAAVAAIKDGLTASGVATAQVQE